MAVMKLMLFYNLQEIQVKVQLFVHFFDEMLDLAIWEEVKNDSEYLPIQFFSSISAFSEVFG